MLGLMWKPFLQDKKRGGAPLCTQVKMILLYVILFCLFDFSLVPSSMYCRPYWHWGELPDAIMFLVFVANDCIYIKKWSARKILFRGVGPCVVRDKSTSAWVVASVCWLYDRCLSWSYDRVFWHHGCLHIKLYFLLNWAAELLPLLSKKKWY